MAHKKHFIHLPPLRPPVRAYCDPPVKKFAVLCFKVCCFARLSFTSVGLEDIKDLPDLRSIY